MRGPLLDLPCSPPGLRSSGRENGPLPSGSPARADVPGPAWGLQARLVLRSVLVVDDRIESDFLLAIDLCV